MIAAILSLTLLGAALGIVLGVANKFLAVEGNPVIDELIAMMPGSNCGQCGFRAALGRPTPLSMARRRRPAARRAANRWPRPSLPSWT